MKSEPVILVIFGITGDLSGRYLLPALYHMVKENLLDERSEIIGVTRGDTTTDQLFEKVELCVNEVDQVCDPDVVQAMRSRTEMFKMDLDDPAAYDALLAKLNSIEESKGLCLHRIYYLSIPPAAYRPVVRLMGGRGLNASCQHNAADTRLLVEKPFGYDLASAEELLDETAKHFKEEQVYRIDHYLAKPAALDFLKQRVEGEAPHADKVEIIAKESIGIEGRAKFYEPLGALRDFIQNHLIQLLSLVLMDRPASGDSRDVHTAKEAALRQINPADPSQAIRGQYRGYTDEVDNSVSTTETYAEVVLSSQEPRWQGVSLRLITGKALDEKRSEIRVGDQSWPLGGNAYEKVILDATRGDRTNFASRDEILESWRILQPLVDAWQGNDNGLIIYDPGSSGPTNLPTR